MTNNGKPYFWEKHEIGFVKFSTSLNYMQVVVEKAYCMYRMKLPYYKYACMMD